jgi:hypothetical protein
MTTQFRPLINTIKVEQAVPSDTDSEGLEHRKRSLVVHIEAVGGRLSNRITKSCSSVVPHTLATTHLGHLEHEAGVRLQLLLPRVRLQVLNGILK